MTERILTLINNRYATSEIDCGEFANMKVNGMKFSIRAFKAAGLGHVSIMRATAMLGLMPSFSRHFIIISAPFIILLLLFYLNLSKKPASGDTTLPKSSIDLFNP